MLNRSVLPAKGTRGAAALRGASSRWCLGAVLLALLPACAQMEPINGCTLAAANRREILRAQHYLQPTIPAKILAVHYVGTPVGHAVLIYRIDEGWCAYDDTYGTRQLPFPGSTMPTQPLQIARAACPFASVDEAHWL